MAGEYPRVYVDGVRLLVLDSLVTEDGTIFENYAIRLGCLPLGIPFRHAGNGWAVIDVEVHLTARGKVRPCNSQR